MPRNLYFVSSGPGRLKENIKTINGIWLREVQGIPGLQGRCPRARTGPFSCRVSFISLRYQLPLTPFAEHDSVFRPPASSQLGSGDWHSSPLQSRRRDVLLQGVGARGLTDVLSR
jgi:hypothetical protein